MIDLTPAASTICLGRCLRRAYAQTVAGLVLSLGATAAAYWADSGWLVIALGLTSGGALFFALGAMDAALRVQERLEQLEDSNIRQHLDGLDRMLQRHATLTAEVEAQMAQAGQRRAPGPIV